MLISFETLIEKYDMNVKGIIHVGAHTAEEHPIYLRNGILDIAYIEPCAAPFKILQEEFCGVSRRESVVLFNCACGEEEGTFDMYTETSNKGMSNSLLAPKMHLQQHPDIEFTGKETIQVKRLDSLGLKDDGFNMLVMDCQGFEDRVLRGGLETLKDIDYVYTEVNRGEVYEGNATIEVMDELLHDFERVETMWVGLWGDALYVRKTLLKK